MVQDVDDLLDGVVASADVEVIGGLGATKFAWVVGVATQEFADGEILELCLEWGRVDGLEHDVSLVS